MICIIYASVNDLFFMDNLEGNFSAINQPSRSTMNFRHASNFLTFKNIVLWYKFKDKIYSKEITPKVTTKEQTIFPPSAKF